MPDYVPFINNECYYPILKYSVALWSRIPCWPKNVRRIFLSDRAPLSDQATRPQTRLLHYLLSPGPWQTLSPRAQLAAPQHGTSAALSFQRPGRVWNKEKSLSKYTRQNDTRTRIWKRLDASSPALRRSKFFCTLGTLWFLLAGRRTWTDSFYQRICRFRRRRNSTGSDLEEGSESWGRRWLL